MSVVSGKFHVVNVDGKYGVIVGSGGRGVGGGGGVGERSLATSVVKATKDLATVVGIQGRGNIRNDAQKSNLEERKEKTKDRNEVPWVIG